MMNHLSLTQPDQALLTMTSREIADLTGKEHKNVTVDIRRMLEELGEDALKFQRIYHDTMNRSQIEFALDRVHTECLITGYNAQLRMKVIKRLHELEDSSRVQLTLPEALRLAADVAEQKLAIENQLADAAPKVEFVDRYVVSSGSMGFREVAKLLNLKETVLRRFLVDKQIMYPLAGKLTPYANHKEAGRFTFKTGESQCSGHAFTQARFTPKGVQWLAKLLVEAGVLGEVKDAGSV